MKMSDVEMSQSDQQVCSQQSDLKQSTQLCQNLRWGTKEELKRKAELARVRYAAKRGVKRKPKSSTERSREMRARKKLLLQSANDQERFPKNEELKLKWMNAIGKFDIKKHSVICSDHFDAQAFHQTDGYTTKRRLLASAVPCTPTNIITNKSPQSNNANVFEHFLSTQSIQHFENSEQNEGSQTQHNCAPELSEIPEYAANDYLEKFSKSTVSHGTEIKGADYVHQNSNNNDISMPGIEMVKIEPSERVDDIDNETEFLDIHLEPKIEFCDIGTTTVDSQLHDHDKNVAVTEEWANRATYIFETTDSCIKLPLKSECPSPDIDVWSDYGNDKEFMKYKRIQDVKWENVVNDPKKATICWEVAVETIKEQHEEIKKLRSKVRSLESKTTTLTKQLNVKKLLSGSAKDTAKTNAECPVKKK